MQKYWNMKFLVQISHLIEKEISKSGFEPLLPWSFNICCHGVWHLTLQMAILCRNRSRKSARLVLFVVWKAHKDRGRTFIFLLLVNSLACRGAIATYSVKKRQNLQSEMTAWTTCKPSPSSPFLAGWLCFFLFFVLCVCVFPFIHLRAYNINQLWEEVSPLL